MSEEAKLQQQSEEIFESGFWGVILPPGEPVDIIFPDNAYLNITSACLPKVDDNTKISRVKTVLKNIPVLECLPDNEDKPTGKVDQLPDNTETETLICTLIPKISEYQKLNVVISPLNYGHFMNTGNSEVHLAGYLTLITDSTIGEEEEEESKEPPKI